MNLNSLKKVLVGSPLATAQARHERLSKTAALAVFSSDALSSVAYATEEIRWVETLIWCAILTAFCALLFPYGLNLPLQLWPRF